MFTDGNVYARFANFLEENFFKLVVTMLLVVIAIGTWGTFGVTVYGHWQAQRQIERLPELFGEGIQRAFK